MSISSIATTPSAMVQSLMDMRTQFDDLQRQLSTGQKSSTYAGLGSGRGLSVSLNAQLSALSSFDDSIDMASSRLQLAQDALTNITTIANNVKSAVVQANGNTSAAVSAQSTAQMSLQSLIGMLNTQAGSRYLFSGRSTDTPALETYDHIINGDGSRAGLTQMIDERWQADSGTSGLGRLTVTSPTATSVALSEDAVSPFGLKLASANFNLPTATVTGPTGSPASLTVDFSAPPSDGDQIAIRLNLPDGTTQDITLAATTQTPLGPNQFAIGATAAITATNFQSALTSAVSSIASSSLKAASAVAASNSFFDADVNNPPQRVDGPPFDTATNLIAGTAANSVIWYTGEAGPDPARDSTVVRIDPAVSVACGTRANETALRNLVQAVSTVAAVSVPSNASAADFSSALSQRIINALTPPAGVQSVADIGSQLANAQSTMQSTKARHAQTGATLTGMLEQISGVSNEQIGAQILTLQTRMQASMQTTAMLYQTSLVNYLR